MTDPQAEKVKKKISEIFQSCENNHRNKFTNCTFFRCTFNLKNGKRYPFRKTKT